MTETERRASCGCVFDGEWQCTRVCQSYPAAWDGAAAWQQHIARAAASVRAEQTDAEQTEPFEPDAAHEAWLAGVRAESPMSPPVTEVMTNDAFRDHGMRVGLRSSWWGAGDQAWMACYRYLAPYLQPAPARPVSRAERNAQAHALLDEWMQGDPEEQREAWEDVDGNSAVGTESSGGRGPTRADPSAMGLPAAENQAKVTAALDRDAACVAEWERICSVVRGIGEVRRDVIFRWGFEAAWALLSGREG